MRRRLLLFVFAAALLSTGFFSLLLFFLGQDQLPGVIAATICLTLLLANTFSFLFVRSLRKLDPHHPESVRTYKELSPLLRRLQTQNETIRIQNEALAHHQEDRDALRREFSANVSHELKTPLTSISGFAELLRDGSVPPETVREFASDIYSEAQRMITLVEDIIHLSQLDENSTPMEHTEVELSAVADRTVQRLSPSARKAGVSLRLAGNRVRITGVELLIEEIFYNLVDNAIKYNHPGGTVTITTGKRNGGTYLSVQDTGIGIPEAHRSRVFERFYRVDKSHSKEVGGTGLGLSIVKHAAAYHNAAVAIESTENVGTTITVLFP